MWTRSSASGRELLRAADIGGTDKAVIEWLRMSAIPLATVAPRHGFKDLEALRPIIGGARIVSLGEATHGTREFFQLKHRLLEFCVAELGFTMLGIEAPFPESLSVNAYVLDGNGNAADALAGMRYWIWDTEEVLDLIEWMRWWNARHSRKVKFYGFIMNSPTAAVLGLIDFLARVAPDLAAACRSELAPLTSDLTTQLFGQLAPHRRAAIFARIAQVRAAFDQQCVRWVAMTRAMDWHLGRLHAIVLERSARFAAEPESANHDPAMAETVCALLEAEGPDAKAVLWSHNAHAGRFLHQAGDCSMGKSLDATFGRAHVAVGLSFGRGAFQARDHPSGVLADHTVTAAAADSFDWVLAQAGLPLFTLDLTKVPGEAAVAAWLRSEMPMRSIGGIYNLPRDNKYEASYTQPVRPREQFDAVVFVAESTAARRNRPVLPDPYFAPLPAPSNLELSGDAIPRSWQALGLQRKYPHAVALDEQPSPRGGRTVRLSRDAPWRWGDGRLVQKIRAEVWRGKRVRFAAAVRTTAQSAGALLFLRFLAKPNRGDESDFFAAEIAAAACTDAPVRSPQWATLAVEADVPEAADSFVIGLAVIGNGTAWFGDLTFAAITPCEEGQRSRMQEDAGAR